MNKPLALFFLFFTLSLHAEEFSLTQHEEGWYWRNEPLENKPLQKEPPRPSPKAADPDKTWKLIGQRVEQARAKAILNPTSANIAEARRLQRLIVAQANLFSELWLADLLTHPEQDESLINPHNNGARTLYNEENSVQKEQLLEQISRYSGFYYFYQAGEPYSEKMAEVVHEFAGQYQIPVMPIAMSHQFSPLFPDSQTDIALANHLGVKHIPALFTLHPVTKEPMPLAYGLVSQSELKDNLLLAFTTYTRRNHHA